MKRLAVFAAMACAAAALWAQKPDVTYLEKVGSGGTRVFAVTTPVKKRAVKILDDKVKLKTEEYACRELLNAILFEGVENYNDGLPLVSDVNNSFARSLLNPKSKTYLSYCKEVSQENSSSNKEAFHYVIELNHFNLLRMLKMRGALSADFRE